MLTLTADILLVAVLPALLIVAAVWDLASFTIPNLLPSAAVVLFFGFVLLVAGAGHGAGFDMSWGEVGLHAAAGAIGLVAGMALFATGLVGGGDAKLFAAASLWLGWDALFEYTLVSSLLGGGLTLMVLALRRVPLPAVLRHQAWLLRLADRSAGVPYGIALAAGALVVLPHTELFRLAAGG